MNKLFTRRSIKFTSYSVRMYCQDIFKIDDIKMKDISGIKIFSESEKINLSKKIKYHNIMSAFPLDRDDVVERTSFGNIRYDHLNKPKYHGQFEHVNDKLRLSQFDDDVPYIEVDASEPDKSVNEEIKQNSKKENDSAEKQHDKSIENEFDCYDLSFIDSQYFKSTYAVNQSDSDQNQNTILPSINFAFNEEWEKFCEEPIQSPLNPFKNVLENNNTNILEGMEFAGDSPLKSLDEVFYELKNLKDRKNTDSYGEEYPDENGKVSSEETNADISFTKPKEPTTAFEYVKQIKTGQREPITQQLKDSLKSTSENAKPIEQDLDLKKISLTNLKKDSLGFYNYRNLVMDIHKFRKEELINYLSHRVLFNDNDIIAIDKPYGLTVQGEKEAELYCLENLLPDLAKFISKKTNELHLVHRLDKNCTGVLLLAASRTMCSTLKSLFAKCILSKYYLAVTRGIPDHKSGIIDIPIEEGSINKRSRMVLRPIIDREYNYSLNKGGKAKNAITNYRLIAKSGNAGLLEVRPEQGLKHQVRVHLGFALRTPILGDHKYSHLDKLVPQKLPQDILQKLHVRQSKVRTIPMHLHAKLLIIPELGRENQNIFIRANLPSHMKYTMSKLGLTSPKASVKNKDHF